MYVSNFNLIYWYQFFYVINHPEFKDTDWYEVQKDEPKRKHLPHFRKKDTGKYQLEFGLNGFKPETPTGLIYGQKIILELSKWTREFEQIYDFDLLPIPFRCNAFDIISG